MIRYTCKDCRCTLEVDDRVAGREAVCLECGCVELVPEATDPQPFRMSAPRSKCPHCRGLMEPRLAWRITAHGWLLFLMLLIPCLPLCWVALFLRTSYQQCSLCRAALDE